MSRESKQSSKSRIKSQVSASTPELFVIPRDWPAPPPRFGKTNDSSLRTTLRGVKRVPRVSTFVRQHPCVVIVVFYFEPACPRENGVPDFKTVNLAGKGRQDHIHT